MDSYVQGSDRLGEASFLNTDMSHKQEGSKAIAMSKLKRLGSWIEAISVHRQISCFQD